MDKIYMCIDLKSFYASVECRERGLDPLNTNLVVADESRTEKTICLAVSTSLKSYGLGGRCGLFEAIKKVKEVNYQRRKENNYKKFIDKFKIYMKDILSILSDIFKILKKTMKTSFLFLFYYKKHERKCGII